MVKQVAANLILGCIVISALVFYTPSIIQPKLNSLTSLGAAAEHRFRQTNCWGFDENWECNTESNTVPA